MYDPANMHCLLAWHSHIIRRPRGTSVLHALCVYTRSCPGQVRSCSTFVGVN